MVECSVWDREVPGSSPGAPTLFKGARMSTNKLILPVFNLRHNPSETKQIKMVDGVKTALSDEIIPPFPFNTLVLSVNYRTETDGLLLLEAQVRRGKKWSRFYKLGLFSKDFQSSFPAQQDAFGHVETDCLVLEPEADAFRYRLNLYGDMEVTLLASCITNARQTRPLPGLPEGAFRAEVEPISQMTLKHKDRRRICSPTALTMALNYFGAHIQVQRVMAEVFDPSAGIYGNWIFNTACAGLYGVESFVRRFASLKELPDFVNKDSLVLASVRYKKGELSNPAIAATPGHLVVITGYEDGKIWTADPAATTAGKVIRPYDAGEFARVWLENKRGVSYIVRKK